jgi:hypothetical protein
MRADYMRWERETLDPGGRTQTCPPSPSPSATKNPRHAAVKGRGDWAFENAAKNYESVGDAEIVPVRSSHCGASRLRRARQYRTRDANVFRSEVIAHKRRYCT